MTPDVEGVRACPGGVGASSHPNQTHRFPEIIPISSPISAFIPNLPSTRSRSVPDNRTRSTGAHGLRGRGVTVVDLPVPQDASVDGVGSHVGRRIRDGRTVEWNKHWGKRMEHGHWVKRVKIGNLFGISVEGTSLDDFLYCGNSGHRLLQSSQDSHDSQRTDAATSAKARKGLLLFLES